MFEIAKIIKIRPALWWYQFQYFLGFVPFFGLIKTAITCRKSYTFLFWCTLFGHQFNQKLKLMVEAHGMLYTLSNPLHQTL